MDDLKQDPFKEYFKATEPDKLSKTYAWATAIGLQAVDGLTPSKYLLDTAALNIEGKITLKEAKTVIESYYEQRPSDVNDEDRTEEADKVSVRIAEILSEPAFSFTSTEYLSIHRRLFQGIYKHAGKIRDYNITKKEWVLNGATVTYGSATELKATLEYDISRERKFDYGGLDMDSIIKHLARFVSRLWQIHVFGEGNTRTTAVFFIKYLRSLGFSADNDLFANNAWYFRNSLVRANYSNLQTGVRETTEFLEVFLRNLLLKENNPLHNRYLHVDAERLFGDFLAESKKVDIDSKKVDIGPKKVDIDTKKVDVCVKKDDVRARNERFERSVSEKTKDFNVQTIAHVYRIFAVYGYDGVFGRGAIVQLLSLKNSSASKLISKLLHADVIEPVAGYGKGKYKFKD